MSAAMAPAAVAAVNVVVGIGMLAVVPVGLRLIDEPRTRSAGLIRLVTARTAESTSTSGTARPALASIRRWWFVGALPGVDGRHARPRQRAGFRAVLDPGLVAAARRARRDREDDVDDLTYAEVGASCAGERLPAGYRHLRLRTDLGRCSLETAGEAILTWRMHRAAGVRIEASAPRAAVGVAVTSGLGIGPVRLSAPCRVVAVIDESDRIGFAYGSLPGHPASGEESFVAERAGDGRVWFTVTSFSRPARWHMRAAGPLAPVMQRAYAWWCGRTLRRLCAAG